MRPLTKGSPSDGPLVVMPPTGAHQLPTPQESQSAFPREHANHSTSWTPIDAITPISTAPSRKRSRDEVALESDSYFPLHQANTPAPIPEEEPLYVECMRLLNPKTGMSLAAETQTGTWYEEKIAKESQACLPARDMESQPQTRPRNTKSIRLDTKISKPAIDDIAVEVGPASLLETLQPEIDDATIALGIGWTKISTEDADTQAAARGWARYLENHYRARIHGAQILLKSVGLNAYLVGCREGYYLFSEDLLEGRLVGRTWVTCLSNLKALPVAFEGMDTLRADRTPASEYTLGNGMQFDGITSAAGTIPNSQKESTAASVGMELD